MKQEAYTYRNIQQLDKAKALLKRAIIVDPGDSEALYTIGVIDWMQAYKNTVGILAGEGLVDDGVGNTKLSRAACESVRASNTVLVDEAIADLTRVVEIKPDNDDAMMYLNLNYRRHAELHCGDSSAISSDLKLADEWSQRAMGVRKQANAVKK
jgi:tetratricopeptide (TPR) repeat protein